MYNAAFRELGLNSVYVAFNVEPDLLAEAVQGIRAQVFKVVMSRVLLRKPFCLILMN